MGLFLVQNITFMEMIEHVAYTALFGHWTCHGSNLSEYCVDPVVFEKGYSVPEVFACSILLDVTVNLPVENVTTSPGSKFSLLQMSFEELW